MIVESILCAALAMPMASVTYHETPSVTAKAFLEEYRQLRDFLTTVDPQGEFLVMPARPHIAPKGYRPLPLRWRGQKIYRRLKENA